MSANVVTMIGIAVTAYVTVLGMIAAFVTASVTAFLAEPLKEYFQNRTRLKNLRMALYKEIMHNYSWMDYDYDAGTDEFALILGGGAVHGFRNECFRQALANSVELFYQLDEATDINIIYSVIGGTGSEFPHRNNLQSVVQTCRGYVSVVATKFVAEQMDKETLKQIATPEQYESVMQRGRKTAMKLGSPRQVPDQGGDLRVPPRTENGAGRAV